MPHSHPLAGVAAFPHLLAQRPWHDTHQPHTPCAPPARASPTREPNASPKRIPLRHGARRPRACLPPCRSQHTVTGGSNRKGVVPAAAAGAPGCCRSRSRCACGLRRACLPQPFCGGLQQRPVVAVTQRCAPCAAVGCTSTAAAAVVGLPLLLLWPQILTGFAGASMGGAGPVPVGRCPLARTPAVEAGTDTGGGRWAGNANGKRGPSRGKALHWLRARPHVAGSGSGSGSGTGYGRRPCCRRASGDRQLARQAVLAGLGAPAGLAGTKRVATWQRQAPTTRWVLSCRLRGGGGMGVFVPSSPPVGWAA